MKKNIFLLIAVFLLSIFTLLNTTQAQPWTQIGNDIDGEATEDYSGYCTSLCSDGSVIAIGAYKNDGNGDNSGHVRIYKNQFGTWTQIGNDIDGEAQGDWSGLSVSLNSDGSVVAIGAPLNNENSISVGHARIYENQNSTWVQIGNDINGEDEEDWFGTSVDLNSDGTVVAIGAHRNSGNGNASGHVRIYKNNNGTWTQVGDDIDGESAGDWSGLSVSLSSDGLIVAIGAPYNDENGLDAGHVRIYEYINDTWLQIGSDIDGEAQGDQSGKSVSLSSDGSIVAIGASQNDGNGSQSGHVRVFKNQMGIWTQIGSDIDGEAANDNSGWSVSLNSEGTIVAIGAIGNSEDETEAGHIRIYQNQNGIWTQIGDDIDGEAADDWFGFSVSLSSDGGIIAAGAPFNSENNVESGHARVFLSPYFGITDLPARKPSIHPSPTKGLLNFGLENNTIQSITISDLAGRVVLEGIKPEQNKTIDISNFENGVYIIRIETKEGMVTKKVIKE